jgi:hypothetical protein
MKPSGFPWIHPWVGIGVCPEVAKEVELFSPFSQNWHLFVGTPPQTWGMKLVTTVKLLPSNDAALLATLEAMNRGAQWSADIARDEKV